MRHRHPSISWENLPRSKRNAQFIRIKNKVRLQAPWFGGLFATEDYVDGASWIDAWILSRKTPRFYNATLDSALSSYFGRCDELAEEAGNLLLPEDFRLFDQRWEKLPGGGSRLLPPPTSQIEAERRAFGGLTRFEWERQESDRLADSGDVFIKAFAELDFSYRFGVGLRATLPCDALGVAHIDAFAAQFLDRREPERFEIDVPISFPSSRRHQRRQANAVGENPADWAAPFGAARQERNELDACAAQAPARAPQSL